MPRIPQSYLAVKTGVYCWHNKVNGKRYVGSGAGKHGIKERKQYYLRELPRSGCHNKHLQAAWDKYGAEAFEFCILERCSPEKCLEREQFWIDHYQVVNPEFGYNNCQFAGNTLGYKYTPEQCQKKALAQLGTKRSEEGRANLKAAQNRPEVKAKMIEVHSTPEMRLKKRKLQLGKKHNSISCLKMSLKRRGKKRSEKDKAKISAGAKKRWQIRKAKAKRDAGNTDC